MDKNCFNKHDLGGQNLNYWVHVMTFMKGGSKFFEEIQQKLRNLVRNETENGKTGVVERWRSDITIVDAREEWEDDPHIEKRRDDEMSLKNLKRQREAIGWDHRVFFDRDPFSSSREERIPVEEDEDDDQEDRAKTRKSTSPHPLMLQISSGLLREFPNVADFVEQIRNEYGGVVGGDVRYLRIFATVDSSFRI